MLIKKTKTNINQRGKESYFLCCLGWDRISTKRYALPSLSCTDADPRSHSHVPPLFRHLGRGRACCWPWVLWLEESPQVLF